MSCFPRPGRVQAPVHLPHGMAHFHHQRFTLTAPFRWLPRGMHDVLALASDRDNEWLIATPWDEEATGFDAFVLRFLSGNPCYTPTADGIRTSPRGIRRISRTYTHVWGLDTLPGHTLKACIHLPGLYVTLNITSLVAEPAFAHRVPLYHDIINSVQLLQPTAAST